MHNPSRNRAWPGLVERVGHFAVACVRHAADGFRRRSPEEINALLAVCETCEYFSGRMCSACGCKCHPAEHEAWLNKLAWKSERCPDDRWPPDIDAQTAATVK